MANGETGTERVSIGDDEKSKGYLNNLKSQFELQWNRVNEHLKNGENDLVDPQVDMGKVRKTSYSRNARYENPVKSTFKIVGEDSIKNLFKL